MANGSAPAAIRLAAACRNPAHLVRRTRMLERETGIYYLPLVRCNIVASRTRGQNEQYQQYQGEAHRARIGPQRNSDTAGQDGLDPAAGSRADPAAFRRSEEH